MDGTIVLVSKDHKRIPVARVLLMEMSKLMYSLLSYDTSITNKQREQELEIHEFKGDVLQIVVDYMQLKKKNGTLSLNDLSIDESLMFDVIAAAAYFQC
ncbi:hypothetical protein WA171_006030 [Blastocystis sp. BT1]